MLNEEFARVMRPGTYFTLLDPALVLEIFCRYDLGLKYATWVEAPLHIAKVRVVPHPVGCIGPTSEFLVGSNVIQVRTLPDYMEFDITGPEVKCAFTWVDGTYRVVAVIMQNVTHIYWYNHVAIVVASQMFCRRFLYVSRPGYIVVQGENFYEMHLVLPQIGYRRRGGCAVM